MGAGSGARVGSQRGQHDADRRLVAERTWVVPTIYDKHYLLHRPWLQGLWASPLGISTMDEVVVRR